VGFNGREAHLMIRQTLNDSYFAIQSMSAVKMFYKESWLADPAKLK
jgi:hypothetical protein